MGQTAEAAGVAAEGIALARTLDHPFTLAQALTFAAGVAQTCRDVESAATHATAGATIARDHDFRLMLAWSSTVNGWASVVLGRHAEGLATLERAIVTARATGSNRFLPYLMACLADAQLTSGRPVDCTHTVEEALATAQRAGEWFYEAELHRLGGEALLTAHGTAAAASAEVNFRRALEVASAQHAQLLSNRAAANLAGLYKQLGHHDEAR
jgi:predicted ATPase